MMEISSHKEELWQIIKLNNHHIKYRLASIEDHVPDAIDEGMKTVKAEKEEKAKKAGKTQSNES